LEVVALPGKRGRRRKIGTIGTAGMAETTGTAGTVISTESIRESAAMNKNILAGRDNHDQKYSKNISKK